MSDKDIRFAVTAEDRFSRVFQTLKRDIAGVGDGVGRLSSVASFAVAAVNPITAAVAAVGAYGLALKSLANDIDALNDASDAIGDSVENLSAIENVARRNGESLDLVVTAATRLNKALSDAKPDSPIAQSLKLIGLSAKELRALPTTEALQRIAVALQGYTNNQQRAAIVAEIFGKSSRQVAAFLNDLAAAGKLNATVTSQQALEAEKFNKSLSALGANAGDLGRTLAGPLLAGFNTFIDRARVAADASKPLEDRFAALFRIAKSAGFGALIFNPDDIDRLKSARTEVESIEQALQRTDISEERRAALELKRIGRLQTIDKLISQQARRPANEGGGGLRSRLLADLADSPDSKPRTQLAVRPPVRLEFAPEVEALQAALRRLEQTDVAKIDRLQSELSALFELQRESRGSPAVVRAIQQINDELDQLGSGRLPTTAIDDPREQQRTDFLRSEKEAYGQVEEYIKDLATNGSKDLDALSVSVDKFADNTIESLLDIGSGADFSASKLFDAFRRDLLREFIEDPVRDSMRNVVKGIKEELSKLDGANNPIAALLKLLSGGGGSGFGSALDGFFGGTGGSGDLTAGGYTGRALGGGVRAGELVRWKENGREWFVPGESGAVVTQAQMQGAQGGVTINNNFQISGGEPREIARQVRAMIDESQSRMARSLRYGKLRQA